VIKKPQRRRLRPDSGCRAIGWMNGWMEEISFLVSRNKRRGLYIQIFLTESRKVARKL
jgi:hypothetical protein